MNYSTTCNVCHRVLKNELSRQIGMGPVCAKKNRIQGESNGMEDDKFTDKYLFLNRLADGIVIRRNADGIVETNIPHLHTDHSPTGFEFGYGGSGPADLALNTLVAVLHHMGYRGSRSEVWDGSMCFDLAWKLHQDFKWQFIAVDRPSIEMSIEVVETWILEHCGLPLTHPFMNAHLDADWQPNTDSLYPDLYA